MHMLLPILLAVVALGLVAMSQQARLSRLHRMESLVATGQIDEYHLLIHPIALGQGRSPFSSLVAPVRLQLIETVVFETGVVAHFYRPR